MGRGAEAGCSLICRLRLRRPVGQGREAPWNPSGAECCRCCGGRGLRRSLVLSLRRSSRPVRERVRPGGAVPGVVSLAQKPPADSGSNSCVVTRGA